MIKLNRKKAKIELRINVPISGAGNWEYTFSFIENDIPTAQLAVNAMTQALQEKLNAIRETEYNKGWADAKAKRKKRDWFIGWW